MCLALSVLLVEVQYSYNGYSGMCPLLLFTMKKQAWQMSKLKHFLQWYLNPTIGSTLHLT